MFAKIHEGICMSGENTDMIETYDTSRTELLSLETIVETNQKNFMFE